jgi:hypothetical protein
MVEIPTDKPVFEREDDDSNNASIKFLSSRKPISNADIIDTAINKKITRNASLNGVFVIEID